jgi:hypothetical protein
MVAYLYYIIGYKNVSISGVRIQTPNIKCDWTL